MEYQLVNQGSKNSMKLQSIGIVLGTPANEIKKGDHLMWNFGSVSVVNEILKETLKTILISTSIRGCNKIYQRRLRKDKLVCILRK